MPEEKLPEGGTGESGPKEDRGTARRKHLRLSAMGPADISIRGGKAQVGYLASIGRGGVGLYLHQRVEPNQLAVVTLIMVGADPVEQELKIVARVRWEKPVSVLYMAGLSFERMSERRQRMLLNHLRTIERLQIREGAKPPTVTPRTRFTIKE